MSNVERFFEALGKDKAMRERLGEQMQELKDANKDENVQGMGVTEFAASEGYVFSEEDLAGMLAAKAQKLADDEIETVSGGSYTLTNKNLTSDYKIVVTHEKSSGGQEFLYRNDIAWFQFPDNSRFKFIGWDNFAIKIYGSDYTFRSITKPISITLDDDVLGNVTGGAGSRQPGERTLV